LSLGETIVALAGTPAGGALAMALALLSALAHAVLGALSKGGRDPLINRGAINIVYGAIALPAALFLFPLPTAWLWLILLGAYVIHTIYEWLQSRAYEVGGFTVVYPIVRGTGPLLIALAAGTVFNETLAAVQWFGLLTLSGGIFGLAWANLRALGLDDLEALSRLRLALILAVITGGFTALYTLYDAWGVREAVDPFTFIVWLFVSGAFGTPVLAWRRWRHLAPEARPAPRDLVWRGLAGGIVATISFGGIMLATRLGSVAEVAAIRETSIVFATIIGVLIFRERLDRRRLGLIGAIVLGAVLIKVV
jgi:drug/metabolite transporter (DMT)-like permease